MFDSHCQKKQDPDPGPYQNILDPQHWPLQIEIVFFKLMFTGSSF